MSMFLCKFERFNKIWRPRHTCSYFRFFHLLWHNPFRLLAIVSKRFLYFKQLIAKYKVQRKETAELDESMIYDYLVKLKSSESSGEFTHFSGKLHTDGWKIPDAKGKGKKNPMLKVLKRKVTLFSPLPTFRKLLPVGVYVVQFHTMLY